MNFPRRNHELLIIKIDFHANQKILHYIKIVIQSNSGQLLDSLYEQNFITLEKTWNLEIFKPDFDLV